MNTATMTAAGIESSELAAASKKTPSKKVTSSKTLNGSVLCGATAAVQQKTSTSTAYDIEPLPYSPHFLARRNLQRHAALASQTLSRLPYSDVKELRVTVSDQSVVVTGFLDSFYHKQIVQKHLQFAYQAVDVIDRMVVLPCR